VCFRWFIFDSFSEYLDDDVFVWIVSSFRSTSFDHKFFHLPSSNVLQRYLNTKDPILGTTIMASTSNKDDPSTDSSVLHEATALPVKYEETGIRRRQTSTTMSAFFTMNNLDDSVKEMFMEYDKDGDGAFSKDEVMNIITDLKKEFHKNETLMMSNLLLKRLLIGGVIFFFLLVGSIFGLSFAVASLTRETSIDSSSGTLFNKDGTMVVATDSRAELHLVTSYDFGDCISPSAFEDIKVQVQEGKNVMVEQVTHDGSSHKLELLSPSGATFDDETGRACFTLPETPEIMYCLTPDGGACNDPENRRKLVNCSGKNSQKPACQTVSAECCIYERCGTECSSHMCIDGPCSCDTSKYCCSGTLNEEQCAKVLVCGTCA
jgi:hypothetical protein